MSRPVPRPGVMAIDPYVPGKSAAPGSGRTFKLSANETPFGPSPHAVQAVRDMADLVLHNDRTVAELFSQVDAALKKP